MVRLLLLLLSIPAALIAQPAQGPRLPSLGSPAPEFAFSAVIRNTRPPATLTPEALLGRVVVLDFFATSCTPCVEAIPRINALVAELTGDPVTFLAVANEPRASLEAFVADHPMSAELVLDDRDQTYGNYFIRTLPFVVIIDPTGHISAFTSPETLSLEQIRTALRPAKASKQG